MKGRQEPSRIEETDTGIVLIEEYGDSEDIVKVFPKDQYERSTRAVGNQQWVANAWAKGKLPTHEFSGTNCQLRTTTENFRGKQYPDGHGELWHYSTIEAWRTPSGIVLINSQCYAKGWARCNQPASSLTTEQYALPLTDMHYRNDLPGLSDIVNVNVRESADDVGYDRLVTYLTGRGEQHYRARASSIDSNELSDAQRIDFLDSTQ